MARFRFKGLEEYELKLARVGSYSFMKKVADDVIYEGARIVTDAIRSATEALPEIDHRIRGDEQSKLEGITSAQKQGLLEGLGITPLSEENGYFNRKIGFDGYNSVATDSYPNGQPNQMIARSVNSGTSFRKKIPFVDQTARKMKPIAEKAMKEKFDDMLKKAWEGD